MKYLQETYGDDIDGNRGVSTISIEMEDTKEERIEIAEKLYDHFVSGESEGCKLVNIYCPIINDTIEVEFEIENYLLELIELGLNDNDLKEDDEFQCFLIDCKNILRRKNANRN
jgi:hypothetical protein